MSKAHHNRVLRESEAVARRMEKSKREIELLKAEYERLLERGIHGSHTSNITDTDKQKEMLSKRDEPQSTTTQQIASASDNLPIRSVTGEYPIKKRLKEKPPENNVVPPSPPKVKHYNVDETREFMRKQKEKRLQQQKILKETDNAIELKKQRLRELHEKTLQIVARNRQRSKSRENQNAVNASQVMPLKLEDPEASAKTRAKVLPKAAPNRTNITYRVSSAQMKQASNYQKSSAKSDDAKIKAATLIQAYFRGHIQRKLYKEALHHRRLQDAATERAKKAVEERKLEEIRHELEAKIRQEREAEEAILAKRPEWLELEPNIYPYNFISSVKRKLNVVLNTPARATTSDVAIQSSFTPEDRTPQRSYKDVREMIAQSLSSKKSDKDLNIQIEKSLAAIRELQSNKNKTPEVLQTITNKSGNHLDLDAKRLHTMKLKSKTDLSDSDTSKNIPDLSMESRLNSPTGIKSDKQASQKVSDELIVVFKRPKEAPPKPKRMSRIDSHSVSLSNSESSSLTGSEPSIKSAIANDKSSKQASIPTEHDDFKLSINRDRFKEIKLKRKIHASNFDNTMSELENMRKSISESIKSKSVSDTESINSGTSRISTVRSDLLKDSCNITTRMSNKSNSIPKSSIAEEESFRKSNQDSSVKQQTGASEKSKTEISNRTTTSAIKDKSSNISKHSHKSVSHSTRTHSSSNPSYTHISKRDSIISGSHISTRSSNSTQNKSVEDTTVTENLQSFREYMKDMDTTQPITYTPFQPRAKKKEIDVEKRMKEVFAKVSELDSSNKMKLGKEQRLNADSSVKLVHESVTTTDNNVRKDTLAERNGDLLAPDVNLIHLKASDADGNKFVSGKTSLDTLPGSSNQIHVKFEAELHLLNDFNESLRQIMNIEKSMIDLQTKYNLPPQAAKNETRDTQTSLMTPKSLSNGSNATSRVDKSINYSRGSDIEHQELQTSRDEVTRNSPRNKQIAYDGIPSILNDTLLITDNSGLEVSELTLNNSNNTLQLETLHKSRKNSSEKLNSAGVSLNMFDQLIKDEDARIENLKTVLKIREKALLDRTKSELTWLEIQKKHLLETGKLHEASLLKKKQRGLILRLQEEKNEMQRLKEIQKAASKERKTVLKEQRNLIKAQLSPHPATKFKRSANVDRRTSGPVKVYNYQSETSVSRKSSISENIVYTSRSESIISKISEDEVESVRSSSDKIAVVSATTSRTEMAKRSLQMREAALQKRRREAEGLLKWHQQLLEEERKIAELEMAASNVINQVPSVENGFKSQVPTFWKEVTVGKQCINERLDTPNSNGSEVSSTSYSMDFDDKNSVENVALERGIKESESTLHEIIQNINNITDEISELYKLSANQSKEATLASEPKNGTSVSETNIERNISCFKSNLPLENKIKEAVPEVSIKSVSSGEQCKRPITKPNSNVDNNDTIINELVVQTQDKTSAITELLIQEKTEEDVSSITDDVQPASLKSVSSSNMVQMLQNDSINVSQANLSGRDSNSAFVGDSSEKLSTAINESITKEVLDVSVASTDKSFVNINNQDNDETCLKTASLSEATSVSDTLVSKNQNNGEATSIHSNDHTNAVDKLVLLTQQSIEEKSLIATSASEEHAVEESSKPVEEDSNLQSKSVHEVDAKSASLMLEQIELIQEESERLSTLEDAASIEDQATLSKILTEDLNIEQAPVDGQNISPVITETKELNNIDDTDDLKEAGTAQSISNSIRTVSNDIPNEDISQLNDAFITSNGVFEENYGSLQSTEKRITSESQIESIIPHQAPIDDISALEKSSTGSNSFKKQQNDNENVIEEHIFINEDQNHEIVVSTSISIPEQYEDDPVSSTSKTSLSEELPILPIIGVTIEEKQVDDAVSTDTSISTNSSSNYSNNVDNLAKEHTQSSNDEDNEVEDLVTLIESPRNEIIGDFNAKTKGKEDFNHVAKPPIDVKKRVSEILADANLNTSIEEKSPRLPDIYVTTYDIVSPDNSPELGSPVENSSKGIKTKDNYGISNEAQELLKKQLAIEQEIKQIERQQKEQLPYIYVREIPNKPPPPYTPPVPQATVPLESIIPASCQQVDEIVPFLAEQFYKAYVNKTLEFITFPDFKYDYSLNKISAEFLFDICKELAIEHYKPFEEVATLVWMKQKRHHFRRPHSQASLETMFKTKLKQLFGFEKVNVKESMIIKWSRKKRDHVDELLVVESQAEEAEWTNYDQDELIVKNDVTNSLLSLLITDTAKTLQEIFHRRNSVGHC